VAEKRRKLRAIEKERAAAEARMSERLVDAQAQSPMSGHQALINLVLRSALLRASRRTETSEIEPAAILRDGASRLLRIRSVGTRGESVRVLS
jgi:hypothetical protein